MTYKNFPSYLNLINYIKDKDLIKENGHKEKLFSLINKLCDEVEETSYSNSCNESYDSGYNCGYYYGYGDGYHDGYERKKPNITN